LKTNQNITGALVRLELTRELQLGLWALASLAVLGLTVWAVVRVLRAGEPALALICVALFGLVVSPVSWSHHWVWALPTVVITAVLACRRRNLALAAVAATGIALMVWPPIDLLPKFHEATASWWRQLAATSYVWWALAVIVVAGATVGASVRRQPTAPSCRCRRPCPL
jgi:alpha-1,2-mannosyltransferase